jgi:hypothetical protein
MYICMYVKSRYALFLFRFDLKKSTLVFSYLRKNWRRGLLISPPPAIEETGDSGRKNESRQGIGW